MKISLLIMDARFRWGGLLCLPEYEFQGTEPVTARSMEYTEPALGRTVHELVDLCEHTVFLVDTIPSRPVLPVYPYRETRRKIDLDRMRALHIRPSIRTAAYACHVNNAIFWQLAEVQRHIPDIPINKLSGRSWAWGTEARPLLAKYFTDYMFGRMDETLTNRGSRQPKIKYLGCLLLLHALEHTPELQPALKDANYYGPTLKPHYFTVTKEGVSSRR